jgi:FKBP-type peptidyl-prolyl cis-trans isomerase 2
VGYVRFSNITSETITVDENHPLAGKDLVFEITLVDIVG